MFVLNCALLMSVCACGFENRRLLVTCCHNNITSGANTSNFTTGKVDFLVGKKLQIMATNDGLYPGYSWKKKCFFCSYMSNKAKFSFLSSKSSCFWNDSWSGTVTTESSSKSLWKWTRLTRRSKPRPWMLLQCGGSWKKFCFLVSFQLVLKQLIL